MSAQPLKRRRATQTRLARSEVAAALAQVCEAPEPLEHWLQTDAGRHCVAILGSLPEAVVAPDKPLGLGLLKPQDIETPQIHLSDRVITVRVVGTQPPLAVFDGLLSAQECAGLVALARPLLRPNPIVDADRGARRVETERRSSQGCYLPHGNNKFVSTVERRVAELLRWPVECLENLQVQHYPSGGVFALHSDYLSPVTAHGRRMLAESGQRIATLVIYLNDVRAGGGTVFPEALLDVMPAAGSASYFIYLRQDGSDDETAVHAGAPVEEGEKWIAVFCLRERPLSPIRRKTMERTGDAYGGSFEPPELLPGRAPPLIVASTSGEAMEYRRLGATGLRLSALSLGSWVSWGQQINAREVRNILAAAYDRGINFFDNAEYYELGEAESLMGQALARLKWPRGSYVVSTKFYRGISGRVNESDTLNRKYLLTALQGSLRRLGLDHVDIVYAHAPDPHTPIEETVWAMHDLIERGHALYWGTSNWSAEDIRGALTAAERWRLRKPVVEQPQYHLLSRHAVEVELARLTSEEGIGLTTYSPLAQGLLTGKYRHGIPVGTRATLPDFDWLRDGAGNGDFTPTLNALQTIADELGCTSAQLAIAWCARRPQVNSVILGASRLDQLLQNLRALEVVPLLTTEWCLRLDEACGKA